VRGRQVRRRPGRDDHRAPPLLRVRPRTAARRGTRASCPPPSSRRTARGLPGGGHRRRHGLAGLACSRPVASPGTPPVGGPAAARPMHPAREASRGSRHSRGNTASSPDDLNAVVDRAGGWPGRPTELPPPARSHPRPLRGRPPVGPRCRHSMGRRARPLPHRGSRRPHPARLRQQSGGPNASPAGAWVPRRVSVAGPRPPPRAGAAPSASGRIPIGGGVRWVSKPIESGVRLELMGPGRGQCPGGIGLIGHPAVEVTRPRLLTAFLRPIRIPISTSCLRSLSEGNDAGKLQVGVPRGIDRDRW